MNEFINTISNIINDNIKKHTNNFNKHELKNVVLLASVSAYDQLDNQFNFNQYIDFTVKHILLPVLIDISINAFFQNK